MIDVVSVDPNAPDPSVVARAAAILRRGGLVAIPTETVYGLAANAFDADAVGRIYVAKGRPSFNPVIVHLADASELPRVAIEVPDLARDLAGRFWPGPLTLVLRRHPSIPDAVTGGSDTVGIRVPDHAVARAVIRAAGVPLAAPSANPFMRVSPTTAQHVEDQLGDRVELVLDAGPASVGIESTVVDLTTDPPRLLRPGGISREALEAVTGALDASPEPDDPTAVRPSPGMVPRHYSPRAALTLFDHDALAEAIRAVEEGLRRGMRVALVSWSAPTGAPALLRMPNEPAAYAARLYAVLHELDARLIDTAWVERPPMAAPGWDAVLDRLTRAAAR